MVDDYLSDREQEEALRTWWRDNWRWIIGGVVLGLALLAGWRYWNAYEERQAGDAARMYDSVRSALDRKDVSEAGKSEVLADEASRRIKVGLGADPGVYLAPPAAPAPA